MKAVDILWDTEDNGDVIPQEELGLPSEVVVPDDLAKNFDEDEYLEDICDWLSDEYGYCIISFDIEK